MEGIATTKNKGQYSIEASTYTKYQLKRIPTKINRNTLIKDTIPTLVLRYSRISVLVYYGAETFEIF